MLNSLLFGESIINDAVAIILFRAVNGVSKTKDEEFGYDKFNLGSMLCSR